MKIKRSTHSADGIALVMVMIVIVALGIIAGGFALSMKVEMRLARQASYDSEFEWLGRSGVELARCLLAEQAKNGAEPYHSLNQKWAGGPGSNTNDPMAEISLTDNQLGNGTFSIEIIDAERKMNINIVDMPLLQNAMNAIGVDAGESPMIVDSIQDWIDRDSDEHISGAESDYYQRLNPPYFAKNNWVDDISELLYVRGIRENPGIFWGQAAANHGGVFAKPGQHNLHDEPVTYPIGLRDLFTTVGGSATGGKLNFNTAKVEALMSIPGIDTNSAVRIVGAYPGRAGADGIDGNEDDTPFRNVQDFMQRGIMPPGIPANALNRYFSARSSAFEVHVKCQLGDFSREYIALLSMQNPRDPKLLNAYWKQPDALSTSGSTGEPNTLN